MRRIGWFHSDSGETSAPTDWRWVAILAAPLFLNFSFCNAYGLRLSGFGPLALDVAVFAAAALISAMFFLGPACAVRARRRSAFQILEEALGAVPAAGVRLCAIVFLAIWVAKLVSIPTLWAIANATE